MNFNYYFAYGSNLNHRQMSMRCPRAKYIRPFTLHNWSLVFRGVADIEQNKGSQVIGGLWEITKDCEIALDLYEGYPHLYSKGYMEANIDGTVEKVMTYVMTHQDCIKSPPQHYLEAIVQGYHDCNIPYRQLKVAVVKSQNETFGTPRAGFSWGLPRPQEDTDNYNMGWGE
jgi:mRNA-degrading endonuclease YafQ of YafQ-DinJ toxin-antitoxin module